MLNILNISEYIYVYIYKATVHMFNSELDQNIVGWMGMCHVLMFFFSYFFSISAVYNYGVHCQ